MLIHHYDHQSGHYVGSSLADEDPRHPGRWLVPAWATTDPLPERLPGTWPFHRDGAWILLPDYRGRVLYRRDTGAVAEILVAGVSPEEQGLTDQPRPSDEHVWHADGWILHPAAVARRKHDVAMAEFARRMEHARRCNAGKADAYAAGLLDDAQIHDFKGWSAYQMALVREVEKETFPEGVVWPEEPEPHVPVERIDPTAVIASAASNAASTSAGMTGAPAKPGGRAAETAGVAGALDMTGMTDAADATSRRDAPALVEPTDAPRADERRHRHPSARPGRAN